MSSGLLAECHFPDVGTPVDLAVSGGPDSLGLLLLALEAGLVATVHHVDHHARPLSGDDGAFVHGVCERLDVTFVLPTPAAWGGRGGAVVDGCGEVLGSPFVPQAVVGGPGANFEARARSARRASMPAGV